ncbi:MAG TPA: site-2 protease family protein [Gaiella sp.]|jgi:regulator of sigma E protease
MTILLAIVGLGVLIFVHELGHFTASLALKMRPRRFYIGFPPAIAKTTRNGIEYGLGAIPLGGFVKIPGMHRPAASDADVAFGRAVEEAPGLGAHVDRLRNALAAGDHDTARLELAAVDEQLRTRHLSEGARRAVERGRDDLEDALGPDAYWRAPTWKRVTAIFAGPAANIVLALVLFTLLFATSGGRATTTVEDVSADSPAASAGLQPGDRIASIDGAGMRAEDISRTISGSEGKPLSVVVVRDGRRVTLGPVSARRSDGVYRLGFVLRGEGLSLPAAVGESFRVTGLVTRDVATSLGRLVTGEGREDIASPVGIVQGSSDAAKRGTDSFIWVLGLISLSIALLNLLPLLPLDGGHIVFAILEGARGRNVKREVYERVSIVGIGLVLLLFFIGLSNDIGRLS